MDIAISRLLGSMYFFGWVGACVGRIELWRAGKLLGTGPTDVRGEEMLRGKFVAQQGLHIKRRRNSQNGAKAQSAGSQENAAQGSIPKADPVVSYMEESNKYFQEEVAEPLKSIFASIRNVRDYVVTSSDIKQNHPRLSEQLATIDDKIWKAVNRTKHVSRRLRTQVEKVRKKVAPAGSSETRPKSVARQNAGKLKAASLTLRNNAFKDAVQSFKSEGYTGSFTMKKGGAVYNKMAELQKARASAAAGSSVSSDAVKSE